MKAIAVYAGKRDEAAIRDLWLFAKRWPQAVRALMAGRYPMEAHLDLLPGNIRVIKNVVKPR